VSFSLRATIVFDDCQDEKVLPVMIDCQPSQFLGFSLSRSLSTGSGFVARG
jgi:hypothetical protein